jgi:hypothetical protein
MANSAALSSAATATALADTQLNPTPSPGRQNIFITLVVDGTAVTAASIHAALDAQYPTVQLEKSVPSRGTYIFNIGP